MQKNTYTGAWITGDGDIMLHCNADWMVDIKTHNSSNSVDDVALLIKNAIERAIRSEFGYVHVYPSKQTYNHPYVSADGDVVLHGELNMNIQIKGIKSDNLMAKIEQVVAAAIEHSASEECNVEYEVIF